MHIAGMAGPAPLQRPGASCVFVLCHNCHNELESWRWTCDIDDLLRRYSVLAQLLINLSTAV
jgi:hypothetical protein